MKLENVRVMHQAKPFQPFRVFMADGRSLDVNHPENLAYAEGGDYLGIANPKGFLEIIDVSLVTRLKPLDGKKNKRSEK